MSTFPAQT